MENDNLERISEKDLKKIESRFKKVVGTFTDSFDKMKGMMGASDLERPKNMFEFESEIDYENYCIEFTEKYKDDITEYANRLFLLSEKSRTTKGDAFELYQILIGGFASYMLLKKVKGDIAEIKSKK